MTNLPPAPVEHEEADADCDDVSEDGQGARREVGETSLDEVGCGCGGKHDVCCD